jgi:membrane-associated HD superfamily phosphohydrolase
MMADAVEAASRSLRDISEKSIGELIEKIISFQMREGQFEEADITFREIRIIKRIFLRKMLNIYHARIEYPEEKKA